MNVFIDDLIRKLLEMRNDGYRYCEMEIIEADDEDNEDDVSFLSFFALDCGSMGGIDYNDDPDTDVTEVPADELEQYADRYSEPSPHRKSIKEIKITY